MNQQEHVGPVSEFISLVSGLCSPDFASVSAIVQPSECVKEGINSVELGYTRNYTHTMGLMWGNLVEFGRN